MNEGDDKQDAGGRWEVAAHLVRDRRLGLAMVGGGIGYFLLSWAGVNWLPCPFREWTGLPCPGCGMTRSCLALLRGDWAAVWSFHPFGPLFAGFWTVVTVGVLLPARARARFADWLGTFERRTRWPLWVLAGLLIYSLTRWVPGW